MERVKAVSIANLCVKLYARIAAVLGVLLVIWFPVFGQMCHLHFQGSLVHKQ